MEEDEEFDLGTLNEYQLITDEDGTVLIQENCVAIKHTTDGVIKLLPMTEEVLHALGLAVVLDEPDEKADVDMKVKIELLNSEEAMQPLDHPVEEEVQPGEETTASIKENDKKLTTTIKYTFTDDDDGDISQGDERKLSVSLAWSSDMVHSLLDLYEWWQQQPAPARRGQSLWQNIFPMMCERHPSMSQWRPGHLKSKFRCLIRTYRGAVDYLENNLHTTKWPYFDKMREIMNKHREDDVQKKQVDTNNDAAVKEHEVKLDQGVENKVTTDQVAADQMDRGQAPEAQGTKDQVKPDQVKTEQVKMEQMTTMQVTEEEQVSDVNESSSPWPQQWLSVLLDVYALLPGASPARLSREVRTRLPAAGSALFTHARLRGQLKYLRDKYYTLRDTDDPAGIDWPLFKKAAQAFGQPPLSENWTRTSTLALIELYEQVARVLDDSGPKFWKELASRFNQGDFGFKVTPRRCETRMQYLCSKYHSLRRADQGANNESTKWFCFEAMHRIYGSKNNRIWPSRTIQLLLSEYQKELPRVDGQRRLWEHISRTLCENTSESFEPAECQQKLLELKQKYCKLMRDPEAARAWPLYKRMSELFSTCLWSKDNVNLLLDLYEAHKERIEGSCPLRAGAAWQELSDAFNERSATICATPAACRTELQVLRARRTALQAAGNQHCPFLQRMNEIFGDKKQNVTVKEEVQTVEAVEDVETAGGDGDNVNSETPEPPNGKYVWTDAAVHRLLRQYERHLPLFARLSREAVWQRVGIALAKCDPNYRPELEGAGVWSKYLEILAKYMDIKENRSRETDWPFFERMEAIIKQQNARDDAASEASEASDRGDSPTRRLEAILTSVRPNATNKRTTDDMSFSDVFAKYASPSVTPLKRRKVDSPRTDEDTTLHLLQLYSEHHRLLNSRAASQAITRSQQHTWKYIAKQMRSFNPQCQLTAEQCRSRVRTLEDMYRNMQHHPKAVTAAQRLTPSVYQKIKTIMEQQNEEQTTNNTKSNHTESNTNTLNGEGSDVLKSILQEIRRKNEINEKRYNLLQKHYKVKSLQHTETMNLMKKILEALNDGDKSVERSDILNMLERKMEEIHK